MRLIITRHGQTYENSQKISMGQGIDGLLNEEGIEQAKKLAGSLKREKIDFVYTSDLKRALHTANEILKFHSSAKKITTTELRERSLGIYEGTPNHKWKNIIAKSDISFDSFKPENGESYSDISNRVSIFLNALVEKHINDNVLLVSHAGTMTILILNILKKAITKDNYDNYKPDNTALTILEISQDKSVSVKFLNSVKHLKTS